MMHPEGAVLDLGCGDNKYPGSVGVDHYPFDGVDLVANLDHTPWPLAADGYDHIIVSHLIEHVTDIPAFMNEVHRVGRHGALVEVTTPHFSSHDSYQDPTHRWHLGTLWPQIFCQGYLRSRVAPFSMVSVDVSFGKNLRYWFPKLAIRAKGLGWWEKNYAFVYPGRDMITRLRVEKPAV
ncbi:MAG: hypothetical protein H0V34_04215 [Gammaproteobacteria bacterium]|nr:hypothetical protein [Gammaproteobacteria bacterium]